MIIDISTKIGTTSNQGGFKGLLDVYSGAAAAYSLRKLSKATTSVVRVRRSSDNAEADFTAQEITDGTLEAWVNTEYTFFSDTFDGTYTWNTVLGSASVTGGVLDFPNTSTTVTFVSLGNTIRTQQVRVTFTILNYVSGTIRFENFNNGASGTLRSGNGTYTEILTISSSGNNNFGFTGDMQGQIDNLVIEQLTADGLVTTWYDQSGNANNATQATAAAQPQIVDGGALITSNGYQVIQYDGTDDNLGTSFTATGTMLMGGSDGGAFYEVAVSGAYNLLASPSGTDHPLKESIRVIWGRTLSAGEQSAIQSRVTYSDWDFSDVTNFYRYWRQRNELTSFPLIDVSNATSFLQSWFGCNSLTSFPLLDVSSGTNFSNSWNSCISLTSFPALNVSSGTNFSVTWGGCTSLQDFPANMFDSVTATNFTNAFANTNLTQTSIDNILVSIDTAGQSGGTFNQSGGSAPSAVGEAAIDNLRARGWTVTVTGGY